MGHCCSLPKLAFNQSLIQQLTQSPFFCLENDEKSALHALSTCFVQVQYSAGHTLWKTGDRNITFNVITDGEVRLEFHEDDGEVVSVSKTSGQCFGGEALHWSDDIHTADTHTIDTTATTTTTAISNTNVTANQTGVLYDCVAVTDLTVYQLSYSALQSFWTSHRPWHDMFSQTAIIPISRYLRSLNVFSSITPHNASLLASMFRWKKIAKHDILFGEGTLGEEFYIVASGCVAVVVKVAKTETKYQLQLDDDGDDEHRNSISENDKHAHHDDDDGDDADDAPDIKKQNTNFVVGGGTGQIAMLDPDKLEKLNTLHTTTATADEEEEDATTTAMAAAAEEEEEESGGEDDTRVVYEFKSGDYFGEVSLVIKIPRTATIQAMEDTTLLELRKSDFERFVPHNSAIKVSLETVAHERIAQSFRRYKIPLFNAVPLDRFHILSKLSHIKYYGAGQVVVDPTWSTERALFVIAHGNVGVYVTKQRVNADAEAEQNQNRNVQNVQNVENLQSSGSDSVLAQKQKKDFEMAAAEKSSKQKKNFQVDEKEESELLSHDGNRGHEKQMSQTVDVVDEYNTNKNSDVKRRVSQHRLSSNLTLVSAHQQRDRLNRELIRLSFLSAQATNNKKNAAKYERLQKQFKAKFNVESTLQQQKEEDEDEEDDEMEQKTQTTPPPASPSKEQMFKMEKALTPPPPVTAVADDAEASDEKQHQITMKVTEAHRDMYQRSERIVRVADLMFPDRSHERLDKILAHSRRPSRVSNLGSPGGGSGGNSGHDSARVSGEQTPMTHDAQLQLPMYSSVRMDPLDPASFENLDFAKSMSTQRWRQHKRSLTPNVSTTNQQAALFLPVAEPSRNMSRSAMAQRVKRQEKEYEDAEQKMVPVATGDNADRDTAAAVSEMVDDDNAAAAAEYRENNGLKLRDFKSNDGKITYTEIEVGVLSAGNFFGETTLINDDEEEDDDEDNFMPSTIPEASENQPPPMAKTSVPAVATEPPSCVPKQTSILELLQASSQSERYISHVSKDSTATRAESMELNTSSLLTSTTSVQVPPSSAPAPGAHTFIDSARKKKKSRKKVTAEQQTMSYHASHTTFKCLTSCVIYSITKENLDEFFRIVPSARRRFDVMLSKYNVDLDTVLHIPRAARFFTLFLESELASENIHYVLSVNEYKEAYNDTDDETRLEMARIITSHFIDEEGKQPINVSGTQRKLILHAVREQDVDAYIFDTTQRAIYLLLERDCFPRFKQSHFFREFLNEEENLAFLTKEQYEQQQKEEEMQGRAESNLLNKVKSLKLVSPNE